jgi:hypothetical protein
MSQWRHWTEFLAGMGPEGLMTAARAIAREIRGAADPTATFERWRDLGVTVRIARLHGRSGAIGPRRMVYVRQGEPADRQRWVAAHEVAHLLIGAAREAGLTGVALDDEERACDAFADVIESRPRTDEITGMELTPPPVASKVAGDHRWEPISRRR